MKMKTDIADWRTNRLKKDKLKGRQRIATAMGRYKGRQMNKLETGAGGSKNQAQVPSCTYREYLVSCG